MVSISECKKAIPCVDCDDKSCLFHGKKEPNCPKYKCDRKGSGAYNCEHCSFIDRLINEMRKQNK